jgi:hypothetical protein
VTKHLHGWSFAQLRNFVEYKAVAVGVKVAFVNPAYTRRKAALDVCISVRRSSQTNFNCAHCGAPHQCGFERCAWCGSAAHDLLATGRYFCALEVCQSSQSVAMEQTQAVALSGRGNSLLLRSCCQPVPRARVGEAVVKLPIPTYPYNCTPKGRRCIESLGFCYRFPIRPY